MPPPSAGPTACAIGRYGTSTVPTASQLPKSHFEDPGPTHAPSTTAHALTSAATPIPLRIGDPVRPPTTPAAAPRPTNRFPMSTTPTFPSPDGTKCDRPASMGTTLQSPAAPTPPGRPLSTRKYSASAHRVSHNTRNRCRTSTGTPVAHPPNPRRAQSHDYRSRNVNHLPGPHNRISRIWQTIWQTTSNSRLPKTWNGRPGGLPLQGFSLVAGVGFEPTTFGL